MYGRRERDIHTVGGKATVTITLEEIQQKQLELQSMIAEFKTQTQPEPCPLEEGKEVEWYDMPGADWLKHICGTIQVTEQDDKYACIIKITCPRDAAFYHARRLLGRAT